MNKSAAVVILAVAIVAGGMLWKSRSDANKQETEVSAEAQGRRPELPRDRRVMGEEKTFLQSDLVANLRAALATQDQALIEKAFEELVAFIQAHPELAEEYLAALRTEPEEQLLRGLAKAMQRSEALMASDEFIKSIVEIAKQQGFEQRQHIMLDTLAQAALIKPELFDAMKQMSEAADQPSEVRASAIAVYADWMAKFPEKSKMIIDELGRSLKETNDDSVRALSVQLLALHKENLPRDVQIALAERLKVEPYPAGQNLICSALSAAAPEIRDPVFRYLDNLFTAETDETERRLLLARLVILNPGVMPARLEQIGKGDSEIARDALDYLQTMNMGKLPTLANIPAIVDPNHVHGEGCKH